ncbi:DUF6624 domain-containing protein [Granulicella cerasi]|uniref:DUF6624 domain-containing protein n=1 Tax=Granulicella cerasi TaxID=741063 RepID=A0ABW1ZBD7_9BACT|nr:DUF6624 domain-containing protein [Granulicella cerasi]
MKTRTLIAALCLATAPLALHAQDDWQKKLAAHHAELVKANGNGTQPDLRDELLAMRKRDQDARFKNIADTQAKKPTDAHELVVLDGELTDELKQIVSEHGWPTIHMVGYDASKAAGLILIHSADHAWQRSLLPQLESLVKENKIEGDDIALVVDKELIAAGKPQRYGTQFKFVDGQAMMYAVEDSAHLDARREQAMLPPMGAYKKMLGEMYHVPVSDVIIKPDAK